jgi:hypothetical protein
VWTTHDGHGQLLGATVHAAGAACGGAELVVAALGRIKVDVVFVASSAKKAREWLDTLRTAVCHEHAAPRGAEKLHLSVPGWYSMETRRVSRALPPFERKAMGLGFYPPPAHAKKKH